MSMVWRKAVLSTIGLFALMLASASSPVLAQAGGTPIPLPAADKAEIENLIGQGVVGEALPAAPLGTLDSFLPPKGSTMSYQVIEKGKTTTEKHRLDDTTDASFSPGWHYSIEGAGSVFFQKSADGSLLTVAEQDLGDKVLSRFSPGEPLIIPGLMPGESRKSTLKIDVYDLSDLTKVSHTGSLDVTYTYVGAYRVTVPAGTFDAVLIRWDYEGKVGPATIKDSQHRFLAPGAGLVAMVQVRSITAMLVYNDHTKKGKLLASKP